MAEVIKVQEYGNQLALIYDDGSRKFAYPTTGGVWYASSQTAGPPPMPGSGFFTWPFPLNQVTSEFGYEERGRLHAGIDFGRGSSNQLGTPIPASGAGKVWLAEPHSGYGNSVIIDHGRNLFTLYAHMSSIAVSVNQTVTQGQTLGGIGNTGASEGLHLHFECHEDGYRWNASARNPREFIPKWNAIIANG